MFGEKLFGAAVALAITAPALAEPPPWAPAHGYRAKHHVSKHHYDPAPRAVVVPHPRPVYYYGIDPFTGAAIVVGVVFGAAIGEFAGPREPVIDRDSAAPAVTERRAKSPSTFPKESARERALSKERQREILEKELATEQDLLASAKTLDDVEAHENNIEALRRELKNLYR